MTQAEADARYYKRHTSKRQAMSQAWKAAHPKQIAYATQKSGAKRRGIPFLFTLDEWIKWWGDDYDLRGVTRYDICMARKGDTGPYEIGNVSKLTNYQNDQDREARRWNR